MTGRVLLFRRPEARAPELSDEALVAACTIGDQAALAALFDRYSRRVHSFLSRVGASGSDVEDLLQETFTAVWKSSRSYRGGSSALTWIFGIAANVARRHARSRARGDRAMAALAAQPTAQPDAADDVASRRQALSRLQAALTRLPHDQRVAFVLCDVEGVSGVDAARALGVRPGTVWRRLHDARKALRAAIEEGQR